MRADDFDRDARDIRPKPPIDEVDSILSLIGRLRSGNRVRRIALSLIRGDELEEGRPLLTALRDPSAPRWREREVAAWVLGRAPLSEQDRAAATGKLLDVVEQTEKESFFRRLGRGILRSYLLPLPIAFFWSTGICMFGNPSWNYDPWPVIFFQMLSVMGTVALPGVLIASLLHDKMLSNRVRAAAATALGHLSTADSIGALAGVLFDRSHSVREAAASALHELLPKVIEEQYGEFGAQSMMNLGRALYHTDTQLVFTILETLKKVGTSHAIPYVERMTTHGRTTRLKDLGEEVLSILRTRQHLEGQKDRLLRPTTAPENPATVLLRPARDAEEIDARLLLRPSGTDEP